MIRRDREAAGIITPVQRGLQDIKHNRFSPDNVLDILKDYQ
ncbi:MAG: hypothetical protein ACKO57_05200 [Alphaproteobacteria bacterium]